MTRAILSKELKVLWASPLPYALGAVFHAAFGVLGWSQITSRGQAVFQPLVPIAGFLLLLAVPVLTSRTFAEEIRAGTLELLFAIPVRRFPLIVGKYVAAFVTVIAIAAPTALFVVLLLLYGDPDVGPISSGLLGLVLLAATVTAIGVLASSLTGSQPVAAIGALFVLLVLWFAHTGSEAVAVGGFLGSLSISERLRGFAGGLIDLSDAVFFVSVVLLALSATAVAVESRRWR